jgi:hypothetical protein
MRASLAGDEITRIQRVMITVCRVSLVSHTVRRHPVIVQTTEKSDLLFTSGA